MPDREAHEPAYPVLDKVLNSIADWVNEHRFASGQDAGLSRCDRNEVMQIARDIGLSAAELQQLAGKAPGSADLAAKMLVALGLDPVALTGKEPLVMRDLQRLCSGCASKGRCSHELDGGTASAHFHEFCPNSYTLDALVAEKDRTPAL